MNVTPIRNNNYNCNKPRPAFNAALPQKEPVQSFVIKELDSKNVPFQLKHCIVSFAPNSKKFLKKMEILNAKKLAEITGK